MSIEWQESLATGIETIDSQHKEIFVRFALFSSACSEGLGDVELLRLLAFLSEYTAVHFREEEEAMSDAGYPELAVQKESHVAFLADFGRLKELVEEKGPDLETILNEKRIMIRWLINHICHLDKAFADFITSLPHPA
jgi:hemerythrin